MTGGSEMKYNYTPFPMSGLPVCFAAVGGGEVLDKKKYWFHYEKNIKYSFLLLFFSFLQKRCIFALYLHTSQNMSTQAMSKAIADYFKTQPVLKAWLFGSYARGEETPISDVDILVQFDEGGISLLKHAAMICELEEILNRPVDIVQEKMLRPRVRESINQDKKLIYERAH